MTTQEFYDKAQSLIDNAYEYETSHKDAGDNYGHLASEGAFDYDNGESRLQEYCKEMGIDLTGVDIDRLAEEVIFWGYMMQGTAYDAKQRFLVASYPVGEIESQVEASGVGARFTPYLIEQLNKCTDAYWTYSGPDVAYFYVNCPDNYWDHVCGLETIHDLVNAMKEV